MRQFIKTVLIGMIFLAGGFGVGATVATFTQSGGVNWEQKYNDLLGEYNALQGDYDGLLNDYNDLQGNYNDLLDDYYGLISDYEALQDAFENPLTNPVLPTYSELYSWLADDDTDSFNYTENWMCGDFSAMLMVRAKEMNWRMRISCMFWSYDGDVGWQDPTHPYGEYGHAFNVILCQDYDGDSTEDWFYIEPQTDTIWYVIIGTESFVHYDIWLTFTGGITGTVWTEPYYINHYSWFA